MNSDGNNNSRGKWPFTTVAIVVVFGCLIGVGIYFLAEKEMRWILLPVMALISGIFLLAIPEKKKVLTAVFVLSFQIDIYLRFLYGRAGSSEGLALPFVVATGLILAGWYYFSGHARHFTMGGSLRRPIGALLIIIAVSAAASSERFIGLTFLITTIEYYFLYWLAFNIVRTHEDFRRVLFFILVTLGIQSIIYFVQSALGLTFDFLGNTIQGKEIPRPGGTVSSNPAGFVSFIIPALMMVSAVALSKFRRLVGWYSLPLMFMGLAAVGLSFTRAAWIGVIFGFMAIGLIAKQRRWLNTRMVSVVVVATAIGIMSLLPKMFERVSSDYAPTGVSATEETFNERMGLNKIAFDIIAHHPFFGLGPGAYGYTFKDYVPPGMNQWLYTVHNVYLLWAAETGIPGGIAFITLLVVAFRLTYRLSREPPSLISICATGCLGALIVLAWMMFWVPWIGFSYNAMLWFTLGIMDGAQRLTPRFSQKQL